MSQATVIEPKAIVVVSQATVIEPKAIVVVSQAMQAYVPTAKCMTIGSLSSSQVITDYAASQ